MRLRPADHQEPGQALEEHLRHVHGAADEVRTKLPLDADCMFPTDLRNSDCVLLASPRGVPSIGGEGSVGVASPY